MKYAKPAFTTEQQADLLLSRGMTGDRETMVSRLSGVNYYRLSGYWVPFKNAAHGFNPGTSFTEVWNRYAFDRHLRLLVMDAIERIEVSVRTRLTLELSCYSGDPFAYANDPNALPGFSAQRRHRFLEDVAEESNRSKESYADHFRAKYGDSHAYMPIWMASEVMSFGCMLSLFRGVHDDIKRAIASHLGIHDAVLESWLLTLNTIRNICAHHGRLWNRVLGIKPKIPHRKNCPKWHDPVSLTNDRVFCILTICRWCLQRIAPQSGWATRLRDLIKRFPTIPLSSMGFPNNWSDFAIWN